MITRRLAPFVFLCSCAPGAPDARTSAIVDGEVSAEGAHPSTVYLWLGGGSCSGTLVSPRVVLTAEHCLAGTYTSELEVFFGNDADGEGTWIGVVHYDTHDYGDIAMLTMEEPGPAQPTPISAVELGPEHLGMPVLLVGFGDTGGAGSAGVKREGATTLEDLDGDIMYVGGDGSKTCYGDSGGPTFVDWDGVRHVAGVSSFITQSNCNYGQSGNVRTDVYYDWLMDYIDTHDPATCGQDQRCAAGCPAVDPDCPCASDGFCDAACADLASDVDCAGCGADGTCRLDCPVLDADCCAADGSCLDACGELDPDCVPPIPKDPPGGPAVGADDDALLDEGCAVAGPLAAPARAAAAWLVGCALVALAALAARASRRRRR